MITSKRILPMAIAAAATAIIGAGIVSAAASPARQQRIAARYLQMLSKAVTDGKLTGAQKTAILLEHDKLLAELNADKGDTKDVRKQDRAKVKNEATAWAKANNLPVSWLLPSRGRNLARRLKHL